MRLNIPSAFARKLQTLLWIRVSYHRRRPQRPQILPVVDSVAAAADLVEAMVAAADLVEEADSVEGSVEGSEEKEADSVADSVAVKVRCNRLWYRNPHRTKDFCHLCCHGTHIYSS